MVHSALNTARSGPFAGSSESSSALSESPLSPHRPSPPLDTELGLGAHSAFYPSLASDATGREQLGLHRMDTFDNIFSSLDRRLTSARARIHARLSEHLASAIRDQAIGDDPILSAMSDSLWAYDEAHSMLPAAWSDSEDDTLDEATTINETEHQYMNPSRAPFQSPLLFSTGGLYPDAIRLSPAELSNLTSPINLPLRDSVDSLSYSPSLPDGTNNQPAFARSSGALTLNHRIPSMQDVCLISTELQANGLSRLFSADGPFGIGQRVSCSAIQLKTLRQFPSASLI